MILRNKVLIAFLFISVYLCACEEYQEIKTPDTLQKTARIILPAGISLSQIEVRNVDGSVFTPKSDLFEVKVRKKGLSLIGALLPSGSWFLTIATPSDEVVYLSPVETAKTLLFLFPGVFESDPSLARRRLNSMKNASPLSDFISEVSPVDDYLERSEFSSYYISAFMSLPEEVFPSESSLDGKPTSSEPAIVSLPLSGGSLDERSFEFGFPYHFKVEVSLIGSDYLISLQPTGSSLCFCGVFGIEAIPQEILSGGVKNSCINFSITSTLGFFTSKRSFEISGLNEIFTIDSNSPALYLLRLSSGSFDLPFGEGTSSQFDELSFIDDNPSLSEIHFKGFDLNLVNYVVSFLNAFGIDTNGVVESLFNREDDIKLTYEALKNAVLTSPHDPRLNDLYSMLVNLLYLSLPNDGIFSYLGRFFVGAGREIASSIDRYPASWILREMLFGGSFFTPVDTLIISVGRGEAEEAFRSINSLLERLKEGYNSGSKERLDSYLTEDFLFNGMVKDDFFDQLNWRRIESIELLEDNFFLSGGAEAEGDVLVEYESSGGYMHKQIYHMLFGKREGKWLLKGNERIAETHLKFWEVKLLDLSEPSYLLEAWVKEGERFPLKSVKLLLPSGLKIDLTKEEGGDTWVIPEKFAYQNLIKLGNLVYLGSSVSSNLYFKLLLKSREGVVNEVSLVIKDPFTPEELISMERSLSIEGNMLSWQGLTIPEGFYPWEVAYIETGERTELNFYDTAFYFAGSDPPALVLRDVYSKKAVLLDPML
ncbi:MAG: nuclear transport factor 2 family protein [Synergistetes bacterium]|nr:nuclear transport factor 2 family protein [Synergistota bacterium]